MLRQLLSGVVSQVHQVQPRSHLTPFVASALVLVPAFALWCGRASRSRTSAALGGLAGFALAVALALTLFRGGYGHERLSRLHRCAITDPLAVSADGLANLVLFAPAAFLLALAVGRPFLVAGGAAVMSLLVEAVQALEWVGVCDSSDVVRNTAGGLAAAVVAGVVRVWWLGPVPAVSGSGPCRRSC